MARFVTQLRHELQISYVVPDRLRRAVDENASENIHGWTFDDARLAHTYA